MCGIRALECNLEKKKKESWAEWNAVYLHLSESFGRKSSCLLFKWRFGLPNGCKPPGRQTFVMRNGGGLVKMNGETGCTVSRTGFGPENA